MSNIDCVGSVTHKREFGEYGPLCESTIRVPKKFKGISYDVAFIGRGKNTWSFSIPNGHGIEEVVIKFNKKL